MIFRLLRQCAKRKRRVSFSFVFFCFFNCLFFALLMQLFLSSRSAAFTFSSFIPLSLYLSLAHPSHPLIYITPLRSRQPNPQQSPSSSFIHTLPHSHSPLTPTNPSHSHTLLPLTARTPNSHISLLHRSRQPNPQQSPSSSSSSGFGGRETGPGGAAGGEGKEENVHCTNTGLIVFSAISSYFMIYDQI